jgi:uncharacterized protein YjbI with pentapeptide repeats
MWSILRRLTGFLVDSASLETAARESKRRGTTGALFSRGRLFTVLLGLAAAPLAALEARAQSTLDCSSSVSGANYTSPQNQTNANFTNLCLKGADFSGVNLSGAVFNNTDLTGANFSGAILSPSGKGSATFTNATLTNASFVGATLNATRLQYSYFNCTDFSNTSLMQANFGSPPEQIFAVSPAAPPLTLPCRTKFVGATIDIDAIATANWGAVDFTNANFQGYSTFNLRGVDVTGAILAGVQTAFQQMDMTGSNLTMVDFSGANLSGARLDGALANGARFDGALLSSASATCASFYGPLGNAPGSTACNPTPPPAKSTPPATPATLRAANLSNANFANANLQSALLNGANLTGGNFTAVNFTAASLEPSQWTIDGKSEPIGAAIVGGSNFTSATFGKAQLNSVFFQNSELSGANFQDVQLTNTSFAGSNLPNSNFSGSTLQGVDFSYANLQSALPANDDPRSFNGATLSALPGGGGGGVLFTCAQLGGADFTSAKAYQVSFAFAVMPGAAQCCPAKGTNPQVCGQIASTGQSYGVVTPGGPTLQSSVTCPNGDFAKCAGTQWQIPNNFTTRACSQNGSNVVMWKPPQCSTGSSGQNVVFNDINLQNCIFAALGVPTGGDLPVTTAQVVTQLSCPGKGIVDLTGLANFKALQTLDLSGNAITQFDFTFRHLAQLDLSSNQLTSLDFSGLDNLISIEAADNQIASVSGMGDVHFLTIDLSNNKLQSFDLAAQRGVAMVNLSGNQLISVLNSSATDLSALASLAFLDLSGNPVLSTIGPVTSMLWKKSRNPAGALKNLFLACSAQFQCATLGADAADFATFPALQVSQCGVFNPQGQGGYTVQTNPVCPGVGASRISSKSRSRR